MQKIVSLFLLLVSANLTAVELGAEWKVQQVIANVDGDSIVTPPGESNYQVSSTSFRGLLDHQIDNWSVDIDYLLVGQYANNLASSNALLLSTPEQSLTFFDLEHVIHQSDETLVSHQLDRVNLMYTSDNWIMKVGRQAVTWGNGIVFHPMDLFNPFSPDAKDTSYKAGTDALYLQYLFDSGNDLQVLWVPRKDLSGDHQPHLDATAIKLLFFVDNIQVDLLLAKDYDDDVIAMGLAGPVGEALWKFDAVNQRTSDDSFLSYVFNIQYSWMWFDRPVSGFAEYYHNDFSDGEYNNIFDLTAELQSRLLRAQLFSVSENNLAIGIQMQIDPLWMMSTNLIHEFDYQSKLVTANFIYNSSDSSNWVFALQIPTGEKGSQYGGLFLNATEQFNLDSGKNLFVRYEYYF